LSEATSLRPAQAWPGLSRDILHVLLLVAFDLFAMYEAFTLAFAIRASTAKPLAHHMTERQFAGLVAALSPLWIVFFAAAGLYSVKRRRAKSSELGRVSVVVTSGVMILIVLEYMQVLGKPIFPSRGVPAYAVPVGVLFVSLCRMFVRATMGQAQRHGHGLHRVVLVGSGALAGRIANDMAAPSSGYRVVAVVAGAAEVGPVSDNTPVFATLDRALAQFDGKIDEVVQADVDLDRGEIARMMSLTTSAGIIYRFVPDQYGIYAAASSMTTIAGVPVMDVRLTALDGWGAIGKRAFDIVGSLVLILAFTPLLLLLAAAVKCSDPAGPVFYRQARLGRGGVPIKVLKFRSMRWQYSTGPGRPYPSAIEAFHAMDRDDLSAEFERHHKVHDDPRITRAGRLLRRNSLDELPQLFDVLRGDLSLIGPRPITADELARYGTQRASFLALKPGVTGLWQVSGRSDVSYEERIKLDLYYIENWSIKLDLTILARTTTAVLAKKGAY
jgi:exopolysaccharide biosynthesis polyprenyl glycosylphosphotransferase